MENYRLLEDKHNCTETCPDGYQLDDSRINCIGIETNCLVMCALSILQILMNVLKV